MSGTPPRRPPTRPVLVQPKGVVKRRSTDVLAYTDPLLKEALRYIRTQGREGITVEDVVAVTLFLASKGADYMTGQAINVTGGREMH